MHNVSKAAREFKTTRKTVRKWLYRYVEHGLVGLKDRPRSPKHIPH
ncbi:MAG: helix-turn-helix domain-containing protein [Candidatus Omnitrophica bacterium]|nr:helix-turn-helix domain-containing protein [Candidatus Omnitrophota bacterium]